MRAEDRPEDNPKGDADSEIVESHSHGDADGKTHCEVGRSGIPHEIKTKEAPAKIETSPGSRPVNGRCHRMHSSCGEAVLTPPCRFPTCVSSRKSCDNIGAVAPPDFDR